MTFSLALIFSWCHLLLLTDHLSQAAFVLTDYLNINPWSAPVNYQLHSSLSVKARYFIPLLLNEVTQQVPKLTFKKHGNGGTPTNKASQLIFFRQVTTSSITFCENEDVAVGQNTADGVTYIDIVQNAHIDCATRGWILHLLLHALGFAHEHQRYDRSNYVYVNSFNIDQGYFSDYARSKLMVDTRLDSTFLPTADPYYDFASVMHYHHTALSSGDKSTLVAIPPYSVSWLSYGHATNMGLNYSSTSVLSYNDILALQQLFRAPEPTPLSGAQFCLNGGTFKNWCMCPPGFGGRYCEQVHCFRKCQNGGSCSFIADVPTCTCPMGFAGNYCELDLSKNSADCTSIGGCPFWSLCVTSTSTPTCDCEPFPYQGATCETPFVYVNTTPAPTTSTASPDQPTTTGTASSTETISVTTASGDMQQTTPVACTFGQVVPTAKPKPFSTSEMYFRIALTDIYYRPQYSDLNSTETQWLQSFLWQVLKVDYTTHSNGKFLNIQVIRIQPPYWGESTWFWNPSQIVAAFGCVIVDFVATFSEPLKPKERQQLLAATARYDDSEIPVFFGRYGEEPLKSTRVSGVGYITPQNLVLLETTACTIYAAEAVCRNGGHCTSFDNNVPSCLCMPNYTGEFCDYLVPMNVEREWPNWLIVFVAMGSLIVLLLIGLVFVYCRNRYQGSNRMWFPPSRYQLYRAEMARPPLRLPRFISQPDQPFPVYQQPQPFVRHAPAQVAFTGAKPESKRLPAPPHTKGKY